MSIEYFRWVVEDIDETLGSRGFRNTRTWTEPWSLIQQCPEEVFNNLNKIGHPLLIRFCLIAVSLSPQLVVSLLYLVLNQHLTRMCQLKDWIHLRMSRQALRVSNPEPESRQVSSYWLSLPYRYSVPHLVSSVILSWLVSNSIFFLRYQFLDDYGNVTDLCNKEYGHKDRYGYVYMFHSSGLAIICSLVFGTIILAVSIAIGFQKCQPGPPLGASNSFVIAAACHPPENDRDAGRKLVQWGVVESQAGNTDVTVKHCTISSRKVVFPVEGEEYA